MNELALLVRVLVTLGFLGIIIRVLGKRGWRSIRPLDLMIAVILGNLSQALILGQMSLQSGVAAIGVLAWTHLFFTAVLQHSRPLRHLAWGKSTVLIDNGQIQYDALAHEKLNDRQLKSLMNEVGVERLGEIAELRLRSDGDLVLTRKEEHRPLTRGNISPHHNSEEDESWQQAA